jgi:hypothetical protein
MESDMAFFDKMERKFGKYAIKNLMFYIIGLYAFGFLIEVFWPDVYTEYLSLNAAAILRGQVWRIVTFIIQPPSTSIFWIFFSLYMYYMIGTILENVWGSFRFNVYFFMGVILNVVAAILIYLVFHINMEFSTYYINLALFLAFATIAPDNYIYLFGLIPIKIKWMAYFDGIYLGLIIVCGYLSPWFPISVYLGLYNLGILSGGILYNYVNATAALISMLNYLVFWIMTRRSTRHTMPGQKAFRKAMRQEKKKKHKGFTGLDGGMSGAGGSQGAGFGQNANGGQDANGSQGAGFGQDANGSQGAGYGQDANGAQGSGFGQNTGAAGNSGQNGAGRGGIHLRMNPQAARHRCAICNRTEQDDESLEFRFCSKCEGNFEYCNEHLYTHIHVKN